MKFRKCEALDLEKALAIVNKKYQGNVCFKRMDFPTVTLTVKSSKGPGARLGYPNSEGKQRRLSAACWHVHGDFFDALFKVNSDAYLFSQGKRIDVNQGNWEDKNIGSQVRPLYFSEACMCGREG